MIRVLSLGAGVQSSTLALMAERGVIRKFDAAIFADTGAEPKAVYEWLEWLTRQVSYPVKVVSAGNLADEAVRLKRAKAGHTYIPTSIPVFTVDGLQRGMGKRQCTANFKITPIEQEARRMTGLKRVTKKHGKVVEMNIGISMDEADRMKPSRTAWIETVWPLIDLGMSRENCFEWMTSEGFPTPPRSACTFCPFHSDEEWSRLTPTEFQEAVEFERRLQEAYEKSDKLVSVPYLHKDRVPLDQVVLKPGDQKSQLDMFRNECSGFCGV